MTSGNISEEPIVVGNDEAKRRLSDLADYFLFHNRDIQMRCDDSVAKVWNGHQVMLRRSRGYAPHSVDLDFSMKEILACGGELKNTFCLTKDNHAFISHHIGDLQNIEAYKYYQDSIEYYKKLFRIKPEAIAYDLHPDYLSTRYALEQSDIKLVGVQHHHAHVVSCMAVNGLNEKVIGVACDGTGYGTDGAIWGCEFMIADQAGFQRRGHLKYVALPGGDMSTKETYRMAVSYLYSVYGNKLFDINIPLFKRINHKKLAFIKSMIEKGVNAPLTSSCGRLFDAVSSLIGVRDDVTYEAQAAIELEMITDSGVTDVYSYNIITGDEYIIDVGEVFRGIVFDLNHEVPKGVISAKFHNTVADFIVSMCEKLRIENDIKKVVLSGGTFQNTYLITEVTRRLTEKEFITYFHKRIPTNDGGLSLGQAVIADSYITN
jgi:hydrogenase maturation protein HypF